MVDEAKRVGDGEMELGLLDQGESRRVGLALMEEAQALGSSDSERWNAYSSVPVRLSVLIPLEDMSLEALLSLAPGQTLISDWQVTQDMPLAVGDVFLGTVSCEPSGERLGIRVNGFDAPSHVL